MRHPDPAALLASARVAAALAEGLPVPRPELARAVRFTLSRLADLRPGKLIEVRVPPFAAVQIGVPGQTSAHTRGTPPHVVETDAATWLALAHGSLSWADAVAERLVAASGVQAHLADALAHLIDDLGPDVN